MSLFHGWVEGNPTIGPGPRRYYRLQSICQTSVSGDSFRASEGKGGGEGGLFLSIALELWGNGGT